MNDSNDRHLSSEWTIAASAVILVGGEGGRHQIISQSITEIFRRLSPDDKIRLLEELWSEVAEEYATTPLSESHF